MQINGKIIQPPGECGLYRVVAGTRLEYGFLNTAVFVQTVLELPLNHALADVTEIHEMAAEQLQWESTPYFIGPQLQPVEEVRPYLQNTKQFCSDVLAALGGK